MEPYTSHLETNSKLWFNLENKCKYFLSLISVFNSCYKIDYIIVYFLEEKLSILDKKCIPKNLRDYQKTSHITMTQSMVKVNDEYTKF